MQQVVLDSQYINDSDSLLRMTRIRIRAVCLLHSL